MKQTDVLVTGCSAASLVAPTTGKRVYPEKEFTVVTGKPYPSSPVVFLRMR